MIIVPLHQQKNPNNLDILAFWLANTSRLLHDMKQYSGDRVSGQSKMVYMMNYVIKLFCSVHRVLYS